MYCSKCGNENQNGEIFCFACGAGLNYNQTPPSQNQSIQQPHTPPQYQQPQHSHPKKTFQRNIFTRAPGPNNPIYKRVWFWVVIAFIGFPLLSVISNSSGISQAEYDKIVLERDAAVEEKNKIITEFESIKAEIDALKSEKDALFESNKNLQGRIDGLELICEENGLVVDEDEIKKIVEAEAAKSDFEKFQERAELVTYDELRRNPDKYKTIPIRITVYVKDEDVDKMFGIMQGGYLCTINGEELAVYDNRTVKEPRLRKGDTVTVYGYSGGLAKMQRKEQGLILDKVVDEWYIPDIRIEYALLQ